MKIILAALLVALPVFAQEYPGDDEMSYGYDDQYAPPPDQGPTFDDFQNDAQLSWNGEWIDTAEYGRVWRPTRVSNDWQPYEYGRWVWTDAGWAWVSDEPFGWAVYHYGRWAWLADAGWTWIPGRVWAPAWVAWRWGDGYAAWCPLGPSGRVYEQPSRWVYVGERHFLDPIRRNVVPVPQRVAVPIRGRGPRAAPPIEVVQRVTGQAVRPLPVRDASAPHAAQPHAGSVDFYRPRTAPVAAQPRLQGPRAESQRPIYFGGVPGPRYGGSARPPGSPAPAQPAQGQPRQAAPAQGSPRPTPHAVTPKPSNSGQAHEKER
ncbi:MAG: hypothetical protein LC689_18280 [Myxococcales bacterium]|nr:hypothetical protein [Myxococcales bacterium]